MSGKELIQKMIEDSKNRQMKPVQQEKPVDNKGSSQADRM